MPAPENHTLACEPHNHKQCIDTALAKAREICNAGNVRLTPTREKVLRLVWQSHKPLGAYDIIGLLSDDKKVVAPPTVYRALEFLQENGLVHRIVSQNAYVGCTMAGNEHISQFLLCRSCGIAIELESSAIAQAVTRDACSCNFSIDYQTIEVTGLCRQCQP